LQVLAARVLVARELVLVQMSRGDPVLAALRCSVENKAAPLHEIALDELQHHPDVNLRDSFRAHHRSDTTPGDVCISAPLGLP
jgi:hypothetical protein